MAAGQLSDVRAKIGNWLHLAYLVGDSDHLVRHSGAALRRVSF